MGHEDVYERIVRKIKYGLGIHESWVEGDICYATRSTITSKIHVSLFLTDGTEVLIGVATGGMGRREFVLLGPAGFRRYLARKEGELRK